MNGKVRSYPLFIQIRFLGQKIWNFVARRDLVSHFCKYSGGSKYLACHYKGIWPIAIYNFAALAHE